MADWKQTLRLIVLLELAVLQACVRADYQVEVRFFRYWNPSHRRGNGNCCEGAGECGNFCDNFFQICVIPEGGRCGAAPFLVERRDTMLRSDDAFINDNDDLVFEEGEEAVQGLPNPVIFNISGPWPSQSDPQRLLAVEIFDLDGSGSVDDDDLQEIGGFVVNLATVSPGNSTGPVQYSNNAGIRDTNMSTFINMSISLRCAEDYYGPECSRQCVAEDSDLGHYTCDSEGFIVCREGYRNTSTSCTQCIPAQGCSDVGGYCEEPGECICRSNYTGDSCEVDLDPCGHTMPCENGATCMNSGVGDFTCACPEGFEGERCELIRTDECDPDPCQNGGTCMDLLADYMCACPLGYGGRNCSVQEATSGDSGSSGVPPAGLAGGVAVVVALVLAILVLVAVLVVVCRRRSSSAKINLQVDRGLDTKGNEVHGTSCVGAPIPLADNEAYGTSCVGALADNEVYTAVQSSGSPEDDGTYVINQLTYDLPQATSQAATSITTEPNVAYGGVQRQSRDSNTYDYVTS